MLVDTGYENIRQVIAVEEQFGTQSVVSASGQLIEPDRGQVALGVVGDVNAKPSGWNFAPGSQTPTGRESLCRTAHHRRARHWHHQKCRRLFVRFRLRGLHQVKNGMESGQFWLSTAAAWPELGCEKHHDRSVILFFLQECIHLTRIFPPASTFPSKSRNPSPTGSIDRRYTSQMRRWFFDIF